VRNTERCPVCTHEWRRHDPEDGKCDAGTDDLGECPCGRDIAFHRVRNAALSLAALAGVQAEPCEHDWKDMRNEYIESGEWCPKCGAIRLGNVQADLPRDS